MSQKDHDLPFDEAFRQKAATPYRVPNGYFEGHTSQILEAVRSQNDKTGLVVKWGGATVAWGSIAAMVAIAMVVAMKGDFFKPTLNPVNLAKATQGYSIDQVALFTDADPDDLVMHGLLHPDSIAEGFGHDQNAAFQLLLDGSIDDSDLADEITI